MKDKMITNKEIVFTTPWFDVEAKTLKSQKLSPYYTLNLSDYVMILALTNNNEILFVKQYRPVLEKYTLELPSGHVEEGQTPEEAARAELLEETGYNIEKIELLGVANPDPGRLNNRLWCYYTDNIKKQDNYEKEQGIEVIKCSQEMFHSLLNDGDLNHAMNLAVFFLARDKKLFCKDCLNE